MGCPNSCIMSDNSAPSFNYVTQYSLLQGKVACITGGLTGIGRAIAIGFLQHGAFVAINYLGGSGDDALLHKLYVNVEAYRANFIAIAGDVSDPETGKNLVKATVDQWGRLDTFVSNAGICTFAEFLESIAPVAVKVDESADFADSLASSQTSTPKRSARILMAHSTASKPLHAKWRPNRLPEGPSLGYPLYPLL